MPINYGDDQPDQPQGDEPTKPDQSPQQPPRQPAQQPTQQPPQEPAEQSEG